MKICEMHLMKWLWLSITKKIGLHLWGADNKDFEDDEALEKYVYIPSDFEEVAVLTERKMLDEETVSEPSEDENTEDDK